MHRYKRVALFLDYENLHASLQHQTSASRQSSSAHPFGWSPELDFHALKRYIERQYGSLADEDFVAVANFSHYDRQKGGLNQVARLIDVDSFEVRGDRPDSVTGKKHVVKNYADTRIAYEIGRYAAQQRADLYIIGSADKAFTAIGHALIQEGWPVVFLVADLDKTPEAIRAAFDYFTFEETQPEEPPPAAEIVTETAELDPQEQAAGELLTTVSELRQKLNNPVPEALLIAIYGPAKAGKLLRVLESQARIDRYSDPDGVAIVTRREERVFGKVVPQTVRPALAKRAAILAGVAHAVAAGLPEASRAGWRRALTVHAGLSVRQAKDVLQELFDAGILRDGALHQPRVTITTVLAFV